MLDFIIAKFFVSDSYFLPWICELFMAVKNIVDSEFAYLFLLSVLPLYYLTFSQAAVDTIRHGQFVTNSTSMVSDGGKFELGFFRPGNGNCYLGMWYKKVSDQTVVWVANRDLPLRESAVLTINKDGNLEILDDRISYKVTDLSSNQNASARLLDSGNLVLADENSNILWQSFDYPSHTFLPGMKIGYNKSSGKSTKLVSWRSSEDPAPGVFSFLLDSKTNMFQVMKGSEIYWTTGAWNGQTFSLVPEMRTNYIFNYTFVSNNKESYFWYDVYDNAIISRFIIDLSGQVKQLTWLESTQQWNLFWSQQRNACDFYAYCGAFGRCSYASFRFCDCLLGFEPRFSEQWDKGDVSGGCVRKSAFNCANTTDFGFQRLSNVLLPANPINHSVMNAAQCNSACYNNCSCTAYAYDNDCSLWVGEILNVKELSDDDPSGRDFYLKLSAAELVSKDKNNLGNKRLLWLILTLSISLTLTATFFFCRMWRQKLKRKGADLLSFDFSITPGGNKNTMTKLKKAGKGRMKEVELPMFSFASVSVATTNFSEINKLGEGGFGPVYKGKLLNGYEVAVKRLSRRSGQGLEELENEAELIAKLQHKNLVKLLGCCIESAEKILVYEYLPNRSLDSFLFDPTKHGILDLRTRIHIIEGIAQGILYLHQYSRVQIIHRDLKASNILLDEDMNPKISDFGMARIFKGKASQATNRIVGTYGYMSPEYSLEGIFSPKSDVYSFGVLFLEILSGKKNTGFYHCNSLDLLGYAWDLWKSNRALELMDPILGEIFCADVIFRCINIALLCVQEGSYDRPAMSDVVMMLSNELMQLPIPKQPAFSNVRGKVDPNSLKERKDISSVNDLTISYIEVR